MFNESIKGLRPEAREIDICGVDEEGNYCYMVAFDKENGNYHGVPAGPVEKEVEVSRGKVLFEDGQKIIYVA